MNLYNSEDTLSVDLTGENLNFDATAMMMPDSVFYQNGGKSNDAQGFYSYQVVLSNETLASGTKTDSGAFGWSTLADSNYKGDGSRQFVHAQNSMVKNGALNTYYASSDCRVEQAIQTDEAAYSQKGVLSPHSVRTSGSGATITKEQQRDELIESSSSDESSQLAASDSTKSKKGIVESMIVRGSEKTASIEMNVNGDTDAVWKDNFVSSSSQYSLSQSISGVVISSVDKLEMKGSATGFPTQTLPPGDLKISYKSTYLELEETLKHFDEAIDKFRAEYPEPLTPALWYYFDQRAVVIPTGSDLYDPSGEYGEFYKMSMQFKVKDQRNA